VFSSCLQLKKIIYSYFTTTYNWLQQAGILFFPSHQLAPGKGQIIFHQLSIGSSKWAYYFSPTKLAPSSGRIIFPKSSNGPSKGAHYFSPDINWLQQAGILFFRNIKLAPESRHMFPQSPTGFSKQACYFSPATNWLQHAGILLFPNNQLAPASGRIIFP